MRKADTLRFGPIEVEDEKVIHFPEGIPAFEQEHEFVIIPYDEESPYVFLQSLKTPDLAFLMTMPFIFFPDYEFELDDENQQKLGLERQEDMLLYVLLTIPQGRVQEGGLSMLVLTRKPRQQIMIGDDIVLHIVEVQGDNVRIAIEAPRSVKIYRGEIYRAIQEENRQAAAPAPQGLDLSSALPPKP